MKVVLQESSLVYPHLGGLYNDLVNACSAPWGHAVRDRHIAGAARGCCCLSAPTTAVDSDRAGRGNHIIYFALFRTT